MVAGAIREQHSSKSGAPITLLGDSAADILVLALSRRRAENRPAESLC